MLKRILMVVMVSCLLPVMAHAASWTLTSAAKTAGGTIQVGSETPRSSLKVAQVNTYTYATGATLIPVTVTVAPAAGYVVSQVVINGVTTLNPTQTVYPGIVGPTAQTFYVYYAVQKFSIASSVAGNVGGTVTPAAITNLSGGALTAAKVVTFTPTNSTFKLSGITGITGTATQSPATPLAGQAVTVTFPVGFVMSSNINLVGTFTSPTPVANAGAAQNVFAGTTVTLDGTGSNLNGVATTYAWTQASGPTVILTNASASKATFIPTVGGTYTFSLKLMPGSSTASTTVTVSADANAKVLADCQNCHSANSVVRATAAYDKWATSKHEVNAVICASCHSGADAGNHPGTVSVSVCINCHNSTLGTSPAITTGHNGITTDFNKTVCTGCHDPHAAASVPPGQPHFSNTTSAGNSASYMTSQAACTNCHNSNANNQTIRQEWKTTGHADINSPAWMNQDFKTLDTCVRCHTTTGFIAYSTAKVTAAWGTAADKTKEVLRCNGCHSDVAAGTVRTITLSKPFASEAGFTNHNVGASNVCMNCHGGTDNGNFIQAKVGSTNFANTPFQYNAHLMTAGGSLQGKTGFNFSGRTYANFSGNSHSKVGMTNSMVTGTSGPCAGCHMSASNKHAFNAISSANGSIAKINTTICVNCHNSSLPAATLDAKRVEFNNALNILRILLADKGFVWDSAAATFSGTNWGFGQAGANVMGAAHNYKLFITEPGAYTHNPAYAKQLITDSIDAAFNNGTVTGSISSALADLYGKGKITVDQVNSINTYKQANSSCNSCHGNPPATVAGGAAHTTSTDCTACHTTYTGPGGATHNNGKVDVSLSCNSCHGNPPSSQSIHITGSVKYTHSQPAITYSNCAQCHATPASPAATTTHINSTVDLFTNATACSSCHGYPPATIAGGGAHVNDTNCSNCHVYTGYTASTHNNGTVNMLSGTAACSSCHGYPPTTQTIHANGSVKYNHNKPAVDYTNCSQCHATPAAPVATATHLNSTVDLLTNANACSSCHLAPPATTAHSSATLVPFNCTNCHTYTESGAASHNNGTVDFSGSLTCDTCHGYPPLPLAQLNARTGGAFANAKIEDYTNGGGYHATHLLSTVSANEGFTPCLPCHPNSAHAQGGGTVLKANVNVFSATDTDYRFDEALPKQYNVATQTCSNVSCHFQPTVSWSN